MSKMWVLDASVVLKWELKREGELVEKALSLHDKVVRGNLVALAPERGNGLRLVAFDDFDMGELLEAMERYSLSIYDAFYVALAIKNRTKVVTLDRRLLKVREWAVSLEEGLKD